jgi:hypothetical protein
MTATPPPLSPADHALIAIASAIAAEHAPEVQLVRMHQLDLQDLLPYVTRAHPVIRDLAAACDLLAMMPRAELASPRSADWSRARWKIGGQVVQIQRVRAGLALERWREDMARSNAA